MAGRGARMAWDRGVDAWERIPREAIEEKMRDYFEAARDHIAKGDPPELTASALRAALDQLGEMTGAIYTNDLLDRIFSRFCIGK